MVGDPYAVFNDPDHYPGSAVLRNLAGLQDQNALEAFEIEMVALRAEEAPPAGPFTPTLYRALHRQLFQDVYPWAGKSRTVRTAKGNSLFCYPEYIPEQMTEKFGWLKRPAFHPGAAPEIFIPAMARFLGELNVIHPFREGNGRTQLRFARLLAQRAGLLLRLEAIEAEPFLAAMIASFDGDLAPLVDEFERMLA